MPEDSITILLCFAEYLKLRLNKICILFLRANGHRTFTQEKLMGNKTEWALTKENESFTTCQEIEEQTFIGKTCFFLVCFYLVLSCF